MKPALALCVVLCAAPVQAGTCFMDAGAPEGQEERFEGAVRNLMVAHMPIEYRNSCGLRDDSDQNLFGAIRKSVACDASEIYQNYFGAFLEDQERYIFASSKFDLRSDTAFSDYCAMVSRLDLNATVRKDGSLNSEMMRVQLPILAALQAHQEKWAIK